MNAPGRNFYVTIGGCVAAMILGALINEDNIAISGGILVLALCGTLYRVFWKGILLEAVVLGFLLFGYIVGEGGFGHLHLGESIYFGEVGLAACFFVFGARVAFTKERFIPRDSLSLAICAFVLIGFLRYLVDCISFSGNTKDLLTITRDFATIYYAAFYFITFNILKQDRSRRFLEVVFPVAIIFLLPVAAVEIIAPEFWISLSYDNQALILPRWDLAESFLGFGSVYFMLSREGRSSGIRRTLMGFICFAFMMAGNSRAGIVAFGLGILFLIPANRLRVLFEYALFGLFGLCVLAVVSMLRPTGDENLTTLFKDRIVSIFDVSASADYATDYGSGKAGNNHFRTEWWKSVKNETMENNPAFGLGFGYDLAARFIRTYDAPLPPAEEFTARSPHSILYTVFGRMGFVGLASLLWMVILIVCGGFRCAVAVRKKLAPATDLAPWFGVIVIFVASCFSVMLEGPMAAIVFWSLLGLASYRQTLAANAREKAESSEVLPRFSSPRKPAVAAASYP